MLKRIVWWSAGAAVLVVVAVVCNAYFSSGHACHQPSGALLMRAVIYCNYGSPDVLRLAAVDKPVPHDDEVLVKVRAASVNPLDWHLMEGLPYALRVLAGLRAPNDSRLGVDYAGTVEAVGEHVTQFKAGDAVFGGRDGALAEYVVVHESHAIVRKPANLSFEQAASVPVAAVTALQALRDHGRLSAGQSVLINGASGGVGTFAVQIAKSLGARVTGVTSSGNVAMVRGIGADEVVDYTRSDYTRAAARYDVILDCVGNHGLLDNRRALSHHGIYVGIGGGGANDRSVLGPLWKPIEGWLLRPFLNQTIAWFDADLTQADLSTLSALLQSAVLTPVIDRVYALEQTPDAIRYLERGHARGKIVVTVP